MIRGKPPGSVNFFPPGPLQSPERRATGGPNGARLIASELIDRPGSESFPCAEIHVVPPFEEARPRERVPDPEAAVRRGHEAGNGSVLQILPGARVISFETPAIEAKEPRIRAEPDVAVARLRDGFYPVRDTISDGPTRVIHLRQRLGCLRSLTEQAFTGEQPRNGPHVPWQDSPQPPPRTLKAHLMTLRGIVDGIIQRELRTGVARKGYLQRYPKEACCDISRALA